MKDYGTRRVELAWISPFRRYAPMGLVICAALLFGIIITLPRQGLSEDTAQHIMMPLLIVVYAALVVLAIFLFDTARRLETAQNTEFESSRELYGLSERLNTTLRSIGAGVISTDVDGLITLMNDVACQLTGWTHGRAAGIRANQVFHVVNEETRQPEESPAKLVLTSGKRVRKDERAILIGRDGSEHPVSYTAAPILDSDDWMIGAVIVFHDVTDLRRMERHREQLIRELSEANEKLRVEVTQRETARRAALSLMQDAQLAQAALREGEERLRTLFEGIDDALLVHDGSGRILDCNNAACVRLGYAREELLRLNIRDLKGEPRDDATAQWMVTQRRVSIPVHIHASAIKYHGADALLILARDITELQQVQDELRQSNEKLRESNAALEEYARVASHDLQEPLRKIESFAQVLVEDYGNRFDAQGRTYLDIMTGAATRMRRLIRDVLAFSRAGTAEKPLAEVELNRALAVAKDNLSERIQERNAQVTVGPLPTVLADETQMIQLFQNLVGNGLKFNDKGRPEVEVSASEDLNDWTIFVKDNGIGMRPAEAQTIFAPFKRLHSQQQYAGTGIGLAICRRIALRHGGTIGVRSEPGKGSTFWVTLPKKRKPAEESAIEKQSAGTDTGRAS